MELTAPPLRELRDRLASCFAPVDAEFLAAGDQLARAIGWLDGIRDGLAALQGTLGGAEVAEAAAALDAAAGAIVGLVAGLEEEAAGVAALEARLGKVGGCIAGLVQVTRGLAQLSVNSAIVSSGIAGQGSDLLDFAAEIRTLLKAAEEVIRGCSQAQEVAVRKLGQVAVAHADFRRRQGPLLRDVAARIRRGLGEVSARQDKARHAAGTLRDRAGRVAAATSASVASLQVGDSTRQRIEHVVDGLDALASGLDGHPEPWCDALSRRDRDALAGRGAALQAALLRGAGESFGAEVARIAAALAQLGDDARGMVDLGATLFGSGGAAAGSFLTSLERDLDLASTLLADAAARRQEVDGAMAEIDGVTATLRDARIAVSNVAIDLRLVGLNAAFRCSRLGPRGVALAAIARELRAQAWQMGEAVDALSAAVEDAVAAGDTVRGAGRAAPALQDTAASMRTSLAALRATGSAMDATIGRLGEDGRHAADSLTAMATGIGAVAQLAGLLQDGAEALERRTAECAAARPDLVRTRLALLHRVPFTMVQERDIARAMGADMPEQAAAELDDMLF
jgi:hypothetical protein